MKKQEWVLTFAVGQNYSPRCLDILPSLNSHVPPKPVQLLVWTPPRLLQSQHSKLTKVDHHTILVAQVNQAHCLKQGYRSSQITAWAERILNSRRVTFSAESKRTQAVTREQTPTYFHYSLDLTPRNKTNISSRITPINLGYRLSFLQRYSTVLKDSIFSSQIFQWGLYCFLCNCHC